MLSKHLPLFLCVEGLGMYVCMHACMHVCMYKYIHIYIHIYICVSVCVYVYEYFKTQTDTYTFIHAQFILYSDVYMRICVYACMPYISHEANLRNLRVHVYTHMHASGQILS